MTDIDPYSHAQGIGMTWMGWESLGEVLTSGPGAASWAPGRLDVFARGTDCALRHIWYDNGWGTWEEDLGGVLASSPAAVSWDQGRIDVFARGIDSALWHKWFQEGWSGWESLGGVLTSSPAVSSWAPGRLDVFARGTDGALYHKWFQHNWSGWERLDGVLSSSPAVVSWSNGRIDVFARGIDSALWHKWWAAGPPLTHIRREIWGWEAGRIDPRFTPPGDAEGASGPTLPASAGVDTGDRLRLDKPGESVPVCVDAVRDVGGTDMTRVTYFVITSEVPAPSWRIRPGLASEFSVEVLGLMGVIFGPDPQTPQFSRPGQIAALFEAVEANPALSVELEDLWIPSSWLAGEREPARGDVYRVHLPLFQAAYRFRSEGISQEEFVERTPWEASIAFSPEETAAFRAWAEVQITEARSAYPKDPQLALGYREDGE